MKARRRLIEIREIAEIWCTCWQVEGSTKIVLELIARGHAYSSHFYLLSSARTLEQLLDEKARSAFLLDPSQFGRRLNWGKDLLRGPSDDEIYFVGRLRAE